MRVQKVHNIYSDRFASFSISFLSGIKMQKKCFKFNECTINLPCVRILPRASEKEGGKSRSTESRQRFRSLLHLIVSDTYALCAHCIQIHLSINILHRPHNDQPLQWRTDLSDLSNFIGAAFPYRRCLLQSCILSIPLTVVPVAFAARHLKDRLNSCTRQLLAKENTKTTRAARLAHEYRTRLNNDRQVWNYKRETGRRFNPSRAHMAESITELS